MWDERFDRPEYVYGTAPSRFLLEQRAHLTPGSRALAIADGEGRNSVYLAEQGLDVVAMDSSRKGLEKARALADARGVTVDFRHGDLADWDWDAAPYDLVVGIFFQFADAALRARIFDGMQRATRPGGLILVHGYTPDQVALGTGGPGRADLMYTPDMLREAFAGCEILRLESYTADLDEGPGHKGTSALIDLVARRPG